MSVIISGTDGITTPAIDSEGNLEYSGTLTGGTGVVNIGSGQVYKDASGNVGIGTNSPGNDIQVARNGTTAAIRITTDTANAAQLRLQSGGGVFEIASIPNSNGQGIAFTQAGFGERARFAPNGSYMVGTTIPDGADGVSLRSSGYITTNRATTDTVTHIQFINPNGVVGSIRTSGTSTSYLTSSDYRLKENLVPITGALARVAQIPVYRFNFKADPDKTVDGFVAHELAPHIPEAVTGEKDAVETVEIKDDEGKVTGTEERPVYQGVDQSKPVPLLTAAIQELLEEVNALKARIEQLENQ